MAITYTAVTLTIPAQVIVDADLQLGLYGTNLNDKLKYHAQFHALKQRKKTAEGSVTTSLDSIIDFNDLSDFTSSDQVL